MEGSSRPSHIAKVRRFMWWNPWSGVTDPWKPRFFRGCDEWHNKSVAVVLPFMGCFIFFWERDFSREGDEHVYARCGVNGWEGAIVDKCVICDEIVREM